MKKIIILLLFISSCQQIEYKSDINYMGSGYANSMESLVYINDTICKDMNDKVGSCIFSINANSDIKITLPKLPYAYKLDFICSNSVPYSFQSNVIKDREYKFDLSHLKYGDVRVFNCIGDIYPQTSDAFRSFEFRAIIVNKDYIQREKIYSGELEGNRYLVLGENSLYGWVYDGWNGYNINKKTFLKVKKDSKDIKAWSCSEKERCNYYGF